MGVESFRLIRATKASGPTMPKSPRRLLLHLVENLSVRKRVDSPPMEIESRRQTRKPATKCRRKCRYTSTAPAQMQRRRQKTRVPKRVVAHPRLGFALPDFLMTLGSSNRDLFTSHYSRIPRSELHEHDQVRAFALHPNRCCR